LLRFVYRDTQYAVLLVGRLRPQCSEKAESVEGGWT
jgi:hypothetical protein